MSNNNIMYTLEEDFTPSSAVNVHYMSPEELEGKEKIPTEIPKSDGREIFHDNDEEKNSQAISKSLVSEKIAKPETDTMNYNLSYQNDYTPIDAINMMRADPSNVMITRYNDNNYVHYNDIKNYMNASDIRDYDVAAKNIINSNDDESLHNNGLKIVLTKSEFDECSEEDKANLEAANIEFEIYK